MDMRSRTFGMVVLTGCLVFSAIGIAHATPVSSTSTIPKPPSAPELDPNALRSGLTLLGGGVLMLAERRRRNRHEG
jgi:hypothetical protein